MPVSPDAVYRRRNEALLPWMRALALAGLTYVALQTTAVFEFPLVVLAALTTATLGLLAPGAGAIALFLLLSIPLLAGNLVAGAAYLLLGFGVLTFRRDNGTRFLLIALTFVASLVHAEWAVVAFAGFLLGSSEGAVLALVACLAIQGAGLVFGLPDVGVTFTGSTGQGTALIAAHYLARIPDPLPFGWLASAVGHFDLETAVHSLRSVQPLLGFVLQPMAWAAGAAVAGRLRRPPGDSRRIVAAFASVAAGSATVAALAVGVRLVSGVEAPAADLLVGAAAAVALGVLAVAVSETWFAPQRAVAIIPDPDVEDLLAAIARAEHASLVDRPVRRTVIITDMESFARLTQEIGSVDAARLVARHREIILPVFARHGGVGSPAGGDGLLAAFEDPSDALSAAADMQRALDTYNVGVPEKRRALVRAGIATGEVVLDGAGRPLLGDALNVAARIMGLASGGQILTSRDVLNGAGVAPPSYAEHGTFALRNIARPVDIVEVLWREGQRPRAPRAPAADPPLSPV